MYFQSFNMERCSGVVKNMLRRKDISLDMQRTELKRCFGLADLTFLAISGMVGSGLYVLSGAVAREIAGPSIVISYSLAAIAAIMSAMCYAEFAARVPVAGSAYQFTYLSVGEFWAFLVGWNVALEHTIYVAAIAKTCSSYLDGIFGSKIKSYMLVHAPMNGNFVAPYPDFLAVLLVFVFAAILVTGVQLSSKVNIVIATINITVILFIIITGLVLADWNNWSEQHFFPYGWSGTIRGATVLVYSYVGYEVVASATEEAVNAGRDIPLSLLISITVVVFSFVCASGVLTLMVPWQDISIYTPYPSAYEQRGWYWAKYVVSIGALAAMVTCLMSVLYVIPRYLLAMSRDGLLWSFLTKLDSTTQVPYISTVIVACFSAFMAMIFDLTTLVEFIAIGQLMACTFVSVCVIKLRYFPNSLSSLKRSDDFVGHISSDDTRLDKLKDYEGQYQTLDNENGTSSTTQFDSRDEMGMKTEASNDQTLHNYNTPSKLSSLSVASLTPSSPDECSNLVQASYGSIKKSVLYSQFGFLFQWTSSWDPGVLPFYSLIIAMCNATFAVAMLIFGFSSLNQWWFIILLTIFLLFTFICISFISCFVQDDSIKTFKVPLVPYIPFASIVINITLMMKLKPVTWVRFAIWLVLGLIVYFSYGYRNSKAREDREADKVTEEVEEAEEVAAKYNSTSPSCE